MVLKKSTQVIMRTSYTCPTCEREYETKEDAEKCYKNCNTCRCLKYDAIYIQCVKDGNYYHDDHWVDILMDFKNANIFKQYRYVFDEGDKESIDKKEILYKIQYCPFCGRKL